MGQIDATTKSSSSVVYPKTINHIAVSVPNLDQAVKWYKEVLGFNMIAGPVELAADDSLTGKAVADIHGPQLQNMRIAWLSSGNQVGFEIFEYIEPKADNYSLSLQYDYARHSIHSS